MPYQRSWVELWLERYCSPGQHRFRQLRADVLICERCRKQELIGGATCLVCGIPGEFPHTIERSTGGADRLTGRLCGSCLDEFEDRQEIGGWRLVG